MSSPGGILRNRFLYVAIVIALLAVSIFMYVLKTFDWFRIITIIIVVMLSVAYFTIAERKIMAGVQRRRGPNTVGFLGLLQPISDGAKLFSKETLLPSNIDIGLFLLAPSWSFVLSLVAWAVIPLSEGILLSEIELGLMYLLAISSLGVYGIIFAGWSSNSKYSYLGALRSASQMISYELTIGFLILSVVVCSGTLNLSDVILTQKNLWYLLPLLTVFTLFSISMLAETNRHPFDLPEAEAELVSGYNVEYSSMTFALFFLGEYANMLQMSAVLSILFLGGWMHLFLLTFAPKVFWICSKLFVGTIFFILTRAALPRYRYDQLMSIGWKCFLPLALAYLIFLINFIRCFNLTSKI